MWALCWSDTKPVGSPDTSSGADRYPFHQLSTQRPEVFLPFLLEIDIFTIQSWWSRAQPTFFTCQSKAALFLTFLHRKTILNNSLHFSTNQNVSYFRFFIFSHLLFSINRPTFMRYHLECFCNSLKSFQEVLSTCWLISLHSAVQPIPNHLD